MTTRKIATLAGPICSVFIFASAALADDQPPLLPDQAPPLTGQSKISAVVAFDLPTLDRELEEKVPKRLADFQDRATVCWHRQMLGREFDVDCEYSGYIERSGGVSLRAERGRLEAATPIIGTIVAQGTDRFTSRIHGTATGALTFFAAARPHLRQDYSVSLDMSEAVRWSEPPTLSVLGFRIGLERYVEPQVRRQMAHVQADVEAGVRRMDLRDKANTAWQHAFATVQLADNPAVWLQTAPQAIAFAGLRARGFVLEGAAEITGNTAVSIGVQPAAQTPTPLPPLGDEVDEPGRFEVVLPVSVAYDTIRQKVQQIVMASDASQSASKIEVYPSGGRLAIGVCPSSANEASGASGCAYWTAAPQMDTTSQALRFPALAISNAPANLQPALQKLVQDGVVTQNLQQQIRLDYKPQIEQLVASANARLSRPLGNGFRSETKLESAGVAGVYLLPDSIRIDIRVGGELRLIYGR